MAYLSKKAYERKREWAGRRMTDNKKIKTLTDEQHEELEWLARIRHEMHTNQDAFWASQGSNHQIYTELISGNTYSNSIHQILEAVGLKNELNWENEFINIPNDFDYNLSEYEGGYGYDNYEDAYEKCIEFANKINNDIEKYLREIDKKHKTNYAPSGHTRIYREGSSLKKKGGMIKGKPHSQGGEHFEVVETGQQIEAEGGEPVVANDALKSNKVKTYKGTNKQILDQINKEVDAKSLNQKADELHAGDFIVCKRSAQDKTVKKITGTTEQIVSAINKSGGCKIEKTGAKVEKAKEGGKTDQLKKGIEVESEHKNLYNKLKEKLGDNLTITEEEFYAEIAKEHIKENPEYYNILEKQGLEKGGEINEIIEKPQEIMKTEEIIHQEGEKEEMTEKQNPDLAPAPKAKREKLTAQNKYEINKQIEKLVEEKGIDRNRYSDEEIQLLSQYSGVGGLQKQYREDIESGKIKDFTGFLYEFYTPDFIVEKMWALAYKYGFVPSEQIKILEPSCATGNFFKYAPKNCKLFGFEINKTSYKICRILFPYADIKHQSFEDEFYMGIESKQMVSMRYNLIIGNPPYAEYKSEYSTEEKKITKAHTWDQYFIMRGADSLLPNGLMVYIIPSSFMKNSDKYNEFKEYLLTKVDFIDAYRLPINSFDSTEIGTDIVVFRKK